MPDTKKTTATTADLSRLNTVMSNMQTELENAFDCLNHVGVLLFDGSDPSDNYTNDYGHISSLFWLAVNALGHFAGMYDFILGGKGNGHTDLDLDQKNIEALKALSGWWNGGDNGEG